MSMFTVLPTILGFCKRHGVKPITCRWVTNEKPESGQEVQFLTRSLVPVVDKFGLV